MPCALTVIIPAAHEGIIQRVALAAMLHVNVPVKTLMGRQGPVRLDCHRPSRMPA
jgi:hypothetical protein